MKTLLTFMAVLALTAALVLAGTGVSWSSAKKTEDERWISYATDEDGIDYFYNAKKIQHMPGNIVRVWVKAVYPEKQTKYREAELLWEIDCSRNAMRGISVKATLKNGKPVDLTKPSSWSDIPAASTAESLYEVVCKKPKTK